MEQTKTVSASALACEGQGPENGINVGPFALGMECNLLPEVPVICQPAVVPVLITGLNYQYLLTHQVWDTMGLFPSDNRHIYCKDLQPFTNVSN